MHGVFTMTLYPRVYEWLSFRDVNFWLHQLQRRDLVLYILILPHDLFRQCDMFVLCTKVVFAMDTPRQCSRQAKKGEHNENNTQKQNNKIKNTFGLIHFD